MGLIIMAKSTLDKYGGSKEIKSEATGFFRLEKADRWCFVTPEGHAFDTPHSA